ncbi:hypothetical protein SUGI_0181790 [Cryptomeria japonica]|nr:hypothetical protein SUGI_0181790 [Cryptomeria japonica]
MKERDEIEINIGKQIFVKKTEKLPCSFGVGHQAALTRGRGRFAKFIGLVAPVISCEWDRREIQFTGCTGLQLSQPGGVFL